MAVEFVVCFAGALYFCNLAIKSCLVSGYSQAKLGVVKITAEVEGEQPKVGTGFIVRWEKDAAYIVTASHVIEGDEIETVSSIVYHGMCVLPPRLARTIHEYLLRHPILSPGGAFLVRPPRRTASTPTSALRARSPGGLQSRTPRDGIHE
jgi:hypothetical protein